MEGKVNTRQISSSAFANNFCFDTASSSASMYLLVHVLHAVKGMLMQTPQTSVVRDYSTDCLFQYISVLYSSTYYIQ